MLVLMASSSGSGVNAETQCLQVVSDGRGHSVCHSCVEYRMECYKKVSHCNKTDGNPTVKLYTFFKNDIVVTLK